MLPRMKEPILPLSQRKEGLTHWFCSQSQKDSWAACGGFTKGQCETCCFVGYSLRRNASSCGMLSTAGMLSKESSLYLPSLTLITSWGCCKSAHCLCPSHCCSFLSPSPDKLSNICDLCQIKLVKCLIWSHLDKKQSPQFWLVCSSCCFMFVEADFFSLTYSSPSLHHRTVTSFYPLWVSRSKDNEPSIRWSNYSIKQQLSLFFSSSTNCFSLSDINLDLGCLYFQQQMVPVFGIRPKMGYVVKKSSDV